MNILIIPSWYDTPDNPVRGIFFKEQAQALISYFKKNNINSTISVLALQYYNIRERHLYSGLKKISVQKKMELLQYELDCFIFRSSKKLILEEELHI